MGTSQWAAFFQGCCLPDSPPLTDCDGNLEAELTLSSPHCFGRGAYHSIRNWTSTLYTPGLPDRKAAAAFQRVLREQEPENIHAHSGSLPLLQRQLFCSSCPAYGSTASERDRASFLILHRTLHEKEANSQAWEPQTSGLRCAFLSQVSHQLWVLGCRNCH